MKILSWMIQIYILTRHDEFLHSENKGKQLLLYDFHQVETETFAGEMSELKKTDFTGTKK